MPRISRRAPENRLAAIIDQTGTASGAPVKGTDDKVVVEECTGIASLDVADNSETRENLEFLNEACLSAEVRTDKSWWRIFRSGVPASVPDVFQRPYLLAAGAWNDASVNQGAWSLGLPAILANNLWTGHLQGRAGFRGTWCFRLEVSASPFAGGFLRLSHAPLSFTNLPIPFTYSVSRLRQLPGVDLDVSTQTAVEFRVPHRMLDPYFYLQPTTQQQYNGTVVLWRRTPANVLDSTALPRWSLWYWFEDVELVGSCVPRSALSNVIPQGGAVTGEQKQTGPLSSFLQSTARVADWGTTLIPTMGAYLTPLAWVARSAARVASAFGYSRPLDQRPLVSTRRLAWGHYNATGVEQAYVAGTFHDTQVTPAPIAGDQEDPLSIPFLVSQWFPLTEVNVPDTTPALKLVCSGSLTPMAIGRHKAPGNSCGPILWDYYYDLTTPPSGTVGRPSFVPSAALWAASWFTYWRGSFKVRLLLSKTKMHSGRLVFLWDYNGKESFVSSTAPFVTPSPNIFLPTSLTDAHPDNKIVIDLRGQDVVEFEIPWYAPIPMRNLSSSIGNWGLYVLDPILHPNTVASFIHVGIEMCMSQDSEFVQPRDSALYPDDAGNPIIAQGGRVDLMAATVGEQVNSMKQLALLPAPVTTGVAYWCAPSTVRDGTTNDITFTSNSNFLLAHIRRLFAAERGSIVITAAPKATFEANQVTMTFASSTALRFPALYQIADVLSNMPRVVIPRYAPLGATYNSIGTSNPTSGYLVTSYNPTIAGVSGTNAVTYISAADDFAAHIFLHTFPVCIRTNSGY